MGMRKLSLLTAGVLVSLALIAGATSTSAPAASERCHSYGSGNPGCRIVKIRDGRFGVPHVVASASLWLELHGDHAGFNLVIYRDGVLHGGAGSGTCCDVVGQLLQEPGSWRFEVRTVPPAGQDFWTGELIHSMSAEIRP